LEANLSFSRLLAILVLFAALGGCDTIRKVAGLDKTPPDEFTVISRAPLDLPPDFSLRPPQAGALRPQETTPTQQARQTVFRAGEKSDAAVTTALAVGNRSSGEVALLKQAGAGESDPNIRQIVNQENSKLLESDRSFTDRLIFWKTPAEPGVVVDPTKEAQRLRENASAGKAATEGETPTIERKKKALLEGIF
jgi:hypothetical protein